MTTSQPRSFYRVASIPVALIVTTVALPAGQAATRTWQATGGSASFNVAGNWGAGGVPGSLDTAAFTGSTATTCNVTASATVAAVTVSGNATLALTAGQTLTVTGDYTQTANTPTVAISGGILKVTGNFNQSAGSFTQSSGTLLLDSTSTKNLTTHSASFFNLAINDGLVGYWKLDEGTTPIADSSGYGNSGTLFNTPSWAAGPTLNFTNANAMVLNGTSEYASLGNSSLLNVTGQITMAAWVKIGSSAGAERNIIAHGHDGNNEVFLRINAGSYQAGSYVNPSNYFTAYAIPGGDVGAWVHLAGVYDGTTWRLYRNGVEVSSSVQGTGAVSVAANWAIGARGDGTSRWFQGTIDDVRIYKRGLDDTEIYSLYIGNQPGTGNGTLTLSGSPTVSSDLILASGRLSVGSGDLTVSGSWNNHGGLFVPGSSTVTLNSTTTEVIRSAGQPFNNLTLSGSGATWTLEDWLKVNSTLTMTNGALSPGANAIHVSNLNKTSGTFAAGSGTLVIDTTTDVSESSGFSFNNLRIETPDETGLVAYYKFDEGQGVVARNSSSTSNNGTLTGASWTDSLPGPISFDNHMAVKLSNSGYGVLGTTSLPSNGAAQTIAFWVNSAASQTGAFDHYMVSMSNQSNSGISVGLLNSNGKLAAWKWGPTALVSTTAPSTGAWHHVVYTCDGANNSTLYLDGASVNTGSTATNSSAPTNIQIGGFSSSGSYTGSIDDLRIYNVALTLAQVQNLYAGRYAGRGSDTTVTLGANLTVNHTLAIDNGTLDTSAFTVNAAATDSTQTATINAGTLKVGSNTATFNGGLVVGKLGTVTEDTANGSIALGTGEALEYDEPAGAAVGFPTAAFDWNSFTFWRQYVTYSSYVGASTADTVLALTADGGTKYSWQLPSSRGSLLGTPRWNTEGTPAVHYIYLITTLGYVYKILDDGTALTTVSGWPYRNLASPGTNATASSPLANDPTNLYWSGKDGANNSQIFSLTMATQAVTTLSVSSALSAAPALATVGGTNYVFFPIGSQAYQVPSPAFGSSSTNSATNTINGRITVYNNIVYFPEAYGFVYALTATNTGAAATAITGWPYQDRTSTGHTGAGCTTSHQCPAISNIYVDIGQSRLCFGDADGHIYVLPSSGTPTPLTGFPWQITSGDVISVAPLSRNGVLLVGATNGTNYKVYEIDETNGTTRALTRTWTFTAAVSSISYNPSANGGNGAYTVGTSDGKLYIINAATDPTPSQR